MTVQMRGSQWARAVAALLSVAVLVVTGYGYSEYRDLSNGLTRSSALDGLADGRSDGAVNILIMGLDSRLDQDGNPLPKAVLDQLHAGDGRNGGYNANVLMVLHIPTDGGKVSAISIPRDDYVELAGRPDRVTKDKIKQVYGLAKDETERKLSAQGVTDRQSLERQGRDAGRRQTVQTVQDLLGLRIDHFVEITLVGFYDVAQALGSVTVCLAGPTQDSYSGARFVAGYQQLNAAQALAFVRQRRDYVHPELHFTDLDRARRQQAFIAAVGHQLQSAGTLTDPAQVHRLIDVVKKDVVIDSHLDLLALMGRAPGLLSGGLTLTTLPVKAFQNVDGEDVNIVDPAQIKSVVRSLIGPDDRAAVTPAALPPATLDVINASGRDGLATSLLNALSSRGLTPGEASTQRRISSRSTLRYAPDTFDTATALSALLGDTVRTQEDPTIPRGHTVLILGTDFVTPTELTAITTQTVASSGSPHAAGSTPTAAGGTPTSTIHADGILCVK
ncbi:MAG: LCP family protein [Pseudonocardia sp.]|nr:LCP family protein [Pseudonocardia sp.]